MKNIYKNWSQSFINGLEYLRGKDLNYLTHPSYTCRATELFNSLWVGVLDLLAPNNDQYIFDKITIHDLRVYYRYGGEGRIILDSLICTSRIVADVLRIAENIYDTECLFFCLAVAQRDEHEARHYFHKILRPIVMMRRIRDVMSVIGEKGGKPRHCLYGEGMLLAMDYQRRHPAAAKTAVAKYVRSELLVNHRRIPAERTIREWLSKF